MRGLYPGSAPAGLERIPVRDPDLREFGHDVELRQGRRARGGDHEAPPGRARDAPRKSREDLYAVHRILQKEKIYNPGEFCMTNEQELFLTCLRDYCHGRPTIGPAGPTDHQELYRLAQDQSLAGVIYEQSRGWPETDQRFRRSLLNCAAATANRRDMLREIAGRFGDAGIPFICMKGSVFRDSWPVGALRSMGDIDLIIKPGDRAKSDGIMLSLGYRKLVNHQDVWTYWIEPFMFEIHDHMFYETLTKRFDYRNYFDTVWDSCHKGAVFGLTAENMYVPDDDLHFLYLMAHTAKHIINSGSGFRAYLDMVFYSRNKDLDWVFLEGELTKMGLIEFTRTCFALCEEWFAVEMPLAHRGLEEGFLETVTRKTFHDGVFGLMNVENKVAKSAKEVRRASGRYWMAALALTIRKLFPSYSSMQLVPWYSWIDRRPWLLPAAWVYRWYYCILHKFNKGTGLLLEPFIKREKVERRETLISDWGL